MQTLHLRLSLKYFLFVPEQCEFDDIQLVITPTGPRAAITARAARWRVCGGVTPATSRHVILSRDGEPPHKVMLGDQGSWCTYLPSGVYTAKVHVTDQEQRDGLQ